MGKRIFVILTWIFLLIIIIFINSAGAAGEICSIKLKGECLDNIQTGYGVMQVSGLTNAHGQILSTTPAYPYVLCCNFGRGSIDTACTSTTPYNNRIIKLFSATNSHAEIPYASDIPPGTNYNTQICYADLICAGYTNTNPSCPADRFGVLSLSSRTNAHIGNYTGLGSYSTKICCFRVGSVTCDNDGVKDAGEQCDGNYFGTATCESEKGVGYTGNLKCTNCIIDYSGCTYTPPLPSLTWSTSQANVGQTVEMRVSNSGLSSGTTIYFEIYDKDILFPDRLDNHTITGVVNADGSASAKWKITRIDLEKSNENIFTLTQIYFKVTDVSEKSDYLRITELPIEEEDSCSDFDGNKPNGGKANCEGVEIDDPIAKNSNNDAYECGVIIQSLSDASCTWRYHCGCSYNTTTNTCSSYGYSEATGTCSISNIGSCTSIESSNDDCADGFLAYNWTGMFKWSDLNNFGNQVECNSKPQNNYSFIDNFCRFNPIMPSGLRYANDTCKDGSKVAPCPAQVQLPFFDLKNLIITIILISVIYFVLEFNKKKK